MVISNYHYYFFFTFFLFGRKLSTILNIYCLLSTGLIKKDHLRLIWTDHLIKLNFGDIGIVFLLTHHQMDIIQFFFNVVSGESMPEELETSKEAASEKVQSSHEPEIKGQLGEINAD